MKKVLITGATGNVGLEIIKSLAKLYHPLQINAGVRDVAADKKKLAEYDISVQQFDFTDVTTYQAALQDCDILFLLRPPQISAVAKYFKPLIAIAKAAKIQHIVFLSVQGVEKSTIIPHHKIEKLITESNIPYTFLRPAYFMQNFTTTLRNDLVHNKRIFLPAGNAKFTLIDVRDIGAVAAKILMDTTKHINQSYELTCNEKLTFKEMAAQLSKELGIIIQYKSPNLLHFYFTKRKEKIPSMLILVMIMLHYFPRFQQAPSVTKWVEKITGRQPTTFNQFIEDNKKNLIQQKT